MKFARASVLFAGTGLFFAVSAFAQSSGKLPEGVIASQGGAQVTMEDIDAYAQKIPEKDRIGFFDSPKRIESVIMSLLLHKQLTVEAQNEKLDMDPGVKAQLQEAREDTLARVAVDHFRKTLKYPDFNQLAHEYYLGNKSEFVVPGALDVEHVLISTSGRTEAEAKARIDEVEAAARAHPEQFAALVEKYSDDPSKKDNHGLMTGVTTGKYVAPFVEAAKALKKPGDISPVVRTEYGFHVLKLVSRKPDTQQTFAEVRDNLIEKLRADFIDRETKDYVNQFRGKALDANPDLVADVRTHFLPAGGKLPSEMIQEAEAEARRKAAEAPQPAH